MDVSGGRGRPQSGNDESAEHTGAQAPAADDSRPEGRDRSPTADPAEDETTAVRADD